MMKNVFPKLTKQINSMWKCITLKKHASLNLMRLICSLIIMCQKCKKKNQIYICINTNFEEFESREPYS